MTEKLYNTDSYLSEFNCVVLSCVKSKNGFDIITDKTAFFPEAGGQTCDKGTLGGITVNHVRIEDETVIHELSAPLEVNSAVHGCIDFKKRFSDMQQHSGEHIVSGLAHTLYGCDNVGFHLGSEAVTIDLNVPLTETQVIELETLSNESVFKNHDIVISFPDDKALSQLAYRSKKELSGAIRIVTIEGVDVCACCAPHVKSTGEIGLIRITGFENYKGGVRLNILCGERGLKDIQVKLTQNKKIGSLLSSKEHETAAYVERLLNENNNLKHELYTLRRSSLKATADSYPPSERIIAVYDSDDSELLRELAIMLKDKVSVLSAVLGCSEGKVSKYVICTPQRDANTVGRAFNASFSARGGGRGEMVQGTVSGDAQALSEFLRSFPL